MQIAAPLARPVRRLLPAGGLGARTRPILLVLLALAVLAGAGAIVYQRFLRRRRRRRSARLCPCNGATSRRPSTPTGSVVATRQAKLVFTNSGRIKDILVNVGDQVKAGQAAGATHLRHIAGQA